MEIKFANFEEFKYWFIIRCPNYYDIFEILEDNEIKWTGTGILNECNCLTIHDTPDDADIESISSEWIRFMENRPEGKLYAYLMGARPYDSISGLYLGLLEAVCLYRVNGYPIINRRTDDEIYPFKNPDKCLDKYERIKDWLISTDFFDAPASTKYHGSFQHGLLIHSLDVVQQVWDLLKVTKFANVNVISAILCAMIHDWCKINRYIVSTRNVKNKDTGVWEQVPYYEKVDPSIPMGHGDTSVYYASRCFNLTLEETLAIKWHMGEYYVTQGEMNDLQTANQNFPLVNLLQFADRLSITKY